MVSTRRTSRNRIRLPVGINLPSELHNYAPRKYGDWQGSYENYKPKPKPTKPITTFDKKRVARKSTKLGYVRWMILRQEK